MNNLLANLTPTRLFLGVPQTSKIQVYAVAQSRSVIVTQAILTNTSEVDTALNLTVNTTDVMRDFKVASGETKIIDLYIVLNEGDTVSLQQDKENAINITLNGAVG